MWISILTHQRDKPDLNSSAFVECRSAAGPMASATLEGAAAGAATGASAGLQVRHDHGSQYMSDAFQSEIRFLGIESSPAFVRQPEGNGCVERFMRTLKEQLLWLRSFRNVEELHEALVLFQERYNEHWLIERNEFRSPRQARQDLLAIGAAA
jgi:putative transposase